MKAFQKLSMILPLALIVLGAGCGDEQQVTEVVRQPDDHFEVAQIVEVLKSTSPTQADSVYLATVPDEKWDEVEVYIRNNGITFFGEEFLEKSTASPTSCSWDGSTERDRTLCEANQYKYNGHNAVYFVVDGPASCYDKSLEWWVLQCSPTHGCVSNWDLRLHGNWYWNGHKWAKNVALIIPTSWWFYYWHWTADFKARRFLLSWNDVNNGCCE